MGMLAGPGGRWRDVGCFLPFFGPPVALAIGWWLGGVWAGLVAALIVGVLALWLSRRLFGSGAFFGLACRVILIVVMVALLVPIVQWIREAAERNRAERDAGAPVAPAPGDPAKED